MSKPKVGQWVEIELVNGKTWVGKLEEWDDEAIFITSGSKEGEENYKAAECTVAEAKAVNLTEKREFEVA